MGYWQFTYSGILTVDLLRFIGSLVIVVQRSLLIVVQRSLLIVVQRSLLIVVHWQFTYYG